MSQPVPLARDDSPLLSLVAWVAPMLLLLMAWMPLLEPMPLPLKVLFTLLAFGLSVLFVAMPRRLGYVLTADGLRVSRTSGQTLWPYAELRAFRTSGRLGLKLCGTGLSGYYTGTYAWHGTGEAHIQAVASRRDSGVIVEYRGKPYFLTPADPEAFLQALTQRGVQVQ